MDLAVSIGKYTLESLTTGMYSNPRDFYREYIQNSVDSIDAAIDKEIIHTAGAWISITINKEMRTILFEDNGIGITSVAAPSKLSDIGNSAKAYSANRGFRGIGRLSGLSYCDKLTFTTSAKGERIKSVFSYDCQKLKSMLVPGEYVEYDMAGVITEVTSIKYEEETENRHYCRVFLEGVEDVDGILDYDEMRDFLSQVGPLPYDSRAFSWGHKIHRAIKDVKIENSEYKIYLQKPGLKEQLFKVHTDLFLTDKFRRIVDNINGIEIRYIKGQDGMTQAVVWYGLSSFYGTILDNSKKGLRLRKGNILIGNRMSLNEIFKEGRFNGWFQGEVFIIDQRIIPNARRDGFEKNAAYYALVTELRKLGDELSRMIRSTSATRTVKNYRSSDKAKMVDNQETEPSTNDLVSAYDRDDSVNESASITDYFEALDTQSENSLNGKLQLYKKLSILTGQEKGITNFKILNIAQRFSNEQKRFLEKIFSIIIEECDIDKAIRLVDLIMHKI